MARPNCITCESGQGTLELALCLPLFVILVLGGAEIANLTWASVQVNNAARAGAAFASISRANAADLTDIQAAAQAEAPRLALTTTSTQNCSCTGTDGSILIAPGSCTSISTGSSSCPSPDVIQVAVQVRTSATVRPFIHYVSLPATYTVHAQATVGVEQ